MFWKNRLDLNLLRRAAKIILSVPVSSASIERLFKEAGLVLSSKLRKNTLSATLMAYVYRKYGEKLARRLRNVDCDISGFKGPGVFWKDNPFEYEQPHDIELQ